jgi:formylglycine-generating enzyme required for sulfatase activity
MAPERWRGNNPEKTADVYSLGVVLYELCAGYVPFRDVPRRDLGGVLQNRDPPPLSRCAPAVDSAFAAVIDRCLARDPSHRFPDGQALWSALVALKAVSSARTIQPDIETSPYPGLRSFATAQRAYFFGRDDDIARICERLRRGPMVLVAGDSGVGKSSIAHAGVLPRLADPTAGETWASCALVPGKRPLAALSLALSRHLDSNAAGLEQELREHPDRIAERLEQGRGRNMGLVIFVDQLEEILSAASEADAAVMSNVLAHLATSSNAVRVLATVRGDKITALTRLPGIATLVQESLYLLMPLTERALRSAVIRPAEMHGFRFESESMVGELVTSSLRAPGGLPLLQFTLAQLWEHRDNEQRIIPGAALAEIGGVEGALSRHADRVLASLLPVARRAAQRMLLRLVTLHGSWDRYTEPELVAGDPANQDALEALVRERLVVVRDIDNQPVYELAHESMVTGWPTLRQWLDEASELHARRKRLAAAALQWDREGRPRDLLWRGRRRRDIEPIQDDNLTPIEAAFRNACRRLARREQLRFLVVAVIGLFVMADYGIPRYLEQREIENLCREAKLALTRARDQMHDYRKTRGQAVELWHAARHADAEESWQRALALASDGSTSLQEAVRWLEFALRRDPEHAAAHRLLAQALHEQARLAAMLARTDEVENLAARLSPHDHSGAYTWHWLGPVNVTLSTSPQGRPVELYQHTPELDELVLVDQAGAWITPAIWLLSPGTYLAVFPGDEAFAEVRFPFRVEAEQAPERHLELHVAIPRLHAVLNGFVYVATGAFLFGFGGDEGEEPVRSFYGTLPLHERRTAAFLIARHETTYAEWIEFLRSLPPGERAQRMPNARLDAARVELTEASGMFRLHFDAVAHEYSASETQMFEYIDREQRQLQDWLRFPVTGISVEDALAFTVWLDSTGLVPGARLCREDEWERAARGADARIYPHGNRLEPDDANHDATYTRRDAPYGFDAVEQRQAAFGFDAVGEHPRSRSPFGVDDMVGNAREMVLSILAPGTDTFVLRSGSFFHEPFTNAVVNREVLLRTQRSPYVGLRVCADVPDSIPSLTAD